MARRATWFCWGQQDQSEPFCHLPLECPQRVRPEAGPTGIMNGGALNDTLHSAVRSLESQGHGFAQPARPAPTTLYSQSTGLGHVFPDVFRVILAASGSEMVGTVKSYNPEKGRQLRDAQRTCLSKPSLRVFVPGWGFVTSPEAVQMFGKVE